MASTWETAIVRYSSDNCFVCGRDNPMGLRIPFYSDGKEVWSEVTWPHHTRGFGGVVHGGLVATVLDEAMFYAVYAQGEICMTVRLSLTLRRSAAPGSRVEVKSSFAGKDRRFFLARAALYDEAGATLAEAEGQFLRVPKLEAHLQGQIVAEPCLSPPPTEKQLPKRDPLERAGS